MYCLPPGCQFDCPRPDPPAPESTRGMQQRSELQRQPASQILLWSLQNPTQLQSACSCADRYRCAFGKREVAHAQNAQGGRLQTTVYLFAEGRSYCFPKRKGTAPLDAEVWHIVLTKERQVRGASR